MELLTAQIKEISAIKSEFDLSDVDVLLGKALLFVEVGFYEQRIFFVQRNSHHGQIRILDGAYLQYSVQAW